MCLVWDGLFLWGGGALNTNIYWHLVIELQKSTFCVIPNLTYTKNISLKSVDFYYGTKTQEHLLWVKK